MRGVALLEANPHVAVSHRSPAQNVAYADRVPRWVADGETECCPWDLFATTPSPLDYDPYGGGILGRPEEPRLHARTV